MTNCSFFLGGGVDSFFVSAGRFLFTYKYKKLPALFSFLEVMELEEKKDESTEKTQETKAAKIKAKKEKKEKVRGETCCEIHKNKIF
jgi:hypothetical protein